MASSEVGHVQDREVSMDDLLRGLLKQLHESYRLEDRDDYYLKVACKTLLPVDDAEYDPFAASNPYKNGMSEDPYAASNPYKNGGSMANPYMAGPSTSDAFANSNPYKVDGYTANDGWAAPKGNGSYTFTQEYHSHMPNVFSDHNNGQSDEHYSPPPYQDAPKPRAPFSPQRKKRAHTPNINVFIDPLAEAEVKAEADKHTAPKPAPKRPKGKHRVPLGLKSEFQNSAQGVKPHDYGDSRPFPRNIDDPFWAATENYDPRPYNRNAPRASQRGVPRGAASSAGNSYSSLPGSGGRTAGPNPTYFPQPTTIRPVRELPTPKNTVLYDILEVHHWSATQQEIQTAYKRVAVKNHPDKMAVADRERATKMMQKINAAKEVLCDERKRKAYHRSGRVPWE